MVRHDGRKADDLRPIRFERGFTATAAGSVLARCGQTVVLCTASIVEGVPEWRLSSGAGWLTAEYEMLPGSTPDRRPRSRTRVDGRTQEIQRLVGRSLRMALDLSAVSEHTIYLDCDVLQADGGTRTTAINGAYVALCDALAEGRRRGLWQIERPHVEVAAISVGVVDGAAVVDLDYREDAAAEVDCNLVMNGAGEWIEVQATGERGAIPDAMLTELLALGRSGIQQVLALQRSALSAD